MLVLEASCGAEPTTITIRVGAVIRHFGRQNDQVSVLVGCNQQTFEIGCWTNQLATCVEVSKAGCLYPSGPERPLDVPISSLLYLGEKGFVAGGRGS